MAKTWWNRALAVLLGMMTLLGLLCACILVTGLDTGLMEKQFRTYGTGAQVDAAYLPAIADEVVDYLAGRRDDLPTFQTHEQAHMVDVRNLFRLAMAVAALGLPAAAGLWLGRKKGFLGVYWKTALGLLGVIAVLVIWGAMDFGSLFVLFHRLAFTNNLWILNPATDLMIQLMPTAFFIDYAARIGTLFAVLAIVTLAGAAYLHRRYRL